MYVRIQESDAAVVTFGQVLGLLCDGDDAPRVVVRVDGQGLCLRAVHPACVHPFDPDVDPVTGSVKP